MYTFFAQYLTIWYGNLADERDRIDGMQDGDYSVLWWSMIALKFVIPFVTLCFPVTRHNPQATVAVACCIILGTMFERYTWISGVNGTGTMPVLMALVVVSVLAAVGFMLVRGAMRRNHLIKG
jgi:lipopolysaccharide export LptBFGC system permease protein LptF